MWLYIGCAYVLEISWNINSPSSSTKEQQTSALPSAALFKSTTVCRIPCVRLAINSTGNLLGVGDADGRVYIYDSSTLRQLTSDICHDFVVTGLGFSSSASAEQQGLKALVVSCSADSTFVAMKYKGGIPILARYFVLALSVLIISILLSKTQLLVQFVAPYIKTT